MKPCSVDWLVDSLKPLLLALPLVSGVSTGCSSSGTSPESPAGGASAAGGSSSTAGAAGSTVVGSSGAGGGGGSSPASGGSTAAGAGGVVAAGGASAGAAGASAGAAGVAGSAGGAGGAAGTSSGSGGAGGFVNNIPADYKGTPFTALQIPGKVNACDYDRGGAGVAYCHDAGNCGAGTVTGDYPSGSGVYRAPMPANAKLCSGAACDDNVGVCRMNPSKPDNTINGAPMPSTDTYLCYSVAGEWTKYTVTVAQA
ncbi:MAG TPA: hypothetical protein VGL19_24665, partial [Polyangiaceae bacterium]